MNATMNTINTSRPRAVWPWVLGGLLLLSLLAAGSGLAWLMQLGDLGHGFHEGVHISLDGEDWSSDGPGAVLAVLAGLLAGGAALVVGLLAVLVVVPLALALALLGVALGIAAAVFSVVAVAAALLLPLWLPLVLLWLLLRRRPAAAPAGR
jgi:hypothetical protein